ncbi:MAG: Hpt domain-containing protein, partial [Planctomycetota bacterium]
MEELDRYIRIFRDEALEHLDTLRTGLLRLEESGLDPASTTPMILRCAHTLKGSARMVGLGEIGNLAHRIEDVLKGIEKSQIFISPELITLLLEGTDLMRDAVEAAARNNPLPEGIAGMIEKVAKAGIVGGPSSPAPKEMQPQAAEKKGDPEKLLTALEGIFAEESPAESPPEAPQPPPEPVPETPPPVPKA